jgi:hypothetical protein
LLSFEVPAAVDAIELVGNGPKLPSLDRKSTSVFGVEANKPYTIAKTFGYVM